MFFGLLNISLRWSIHAQGEIDISSPDGNGQKSPLFHPPNPKDAKTPFSTGKAAAILTRGAYSQYVSTATWQERRWRHFSTFPFSKSS
ncbi:MAG: hypothetical protein VST68_07950 [Nitrospirota bacterium]|nr:hypothetical protein [Nitrospirota bacterium]